MREMLGIDQFFCFLCLLLSHQTQKVAATSKSRGAVVVDININIPMSFSWLLPVVSLAL
jgi:hypothetical protein